MRKPEKVLVLFLLSSILLVSGLAAQSDASSASSQSDASIFDTSTFDSTVQKSQAQEKTDALSYLVGGTFLSDMSVGTTTLFDGYTAAGGFSGKVFGKVSVPSVGQLYLGYNFQHTLFQGAGGSMSAVPMGSGLLSNSYALSEFFFDFDIEKALFLRVGNQLIAWGPSYVWTPVDFINLQKASSLQTLDLRAGKPGIKLFLPFPSWDITVFTDFSNAIANGIVGDLSKTTNIAARTAFTLGGFEFGLSGYLGQFIQDRFGFDFSGNLFSFTVYGELATYVPYGNYDFNYAGSVGLSRTFGDLKRWSAQAEFFANSKGTDTVSNYPAMIASQSFVPLYVGKLYGYAAITRQQLFGQFLDLTLSGISNFSDGSYQAKLAAKFSIPRLVPFTASVSYNGGGSGKEFTYFSGNDALGLDLQILVQF